MTVESVHFSNRVVRNMITSLRVRFRCSATQTWNMAHLPEITTHSVTVCLLKAHGKDDAVSLTDPYEQVPSLVWIVNQSVRKHQMHAEPGDTWLQVLVPPLASIRMVQCRSLERCISQRSGILWRYLRQSAFRCRVPRRVVRRTRSNLAGMVTH